MDRNSGKAPSTAGTEGKAVSGGAEPKTATPVETENSSDNGGSRIYSRLHIAYFHGQKVLGL